MLEAVVSSAVSLPKRLVTPIGRQFSYLCNYETNFDILKEETLKLTEGREIVHHIVDAAIRNGEEIVQDVNTWLASVDNIMNETEKLLEDQATVKSHCCKGMCPSLKTRYQLSKEAVRKMKAIARLREEGKFELVSYRTIAQEIWLPAGRGYVSFESRFKTLRGIQEALSDPNVNMVGVYGMGGIGKTTLVKEIAMEAEKDKLFDEVVFAKVSQTPDMKKIQQEISERLGLVFREVTESGRASRLSQRLKRSEKKILVILDDIWEYLDLETIGIPLGDNNKGCKVLLTARDLNLLTTMGCEKNVLVGILNEEEAWSLFKKMAGDCTENHDLQSIAKDVANECGGLPIAIVSVARALRNKSIYEWKSALQELKRPSKRNFTGIQEAAYSSIELSYNHLKDEELKSIFLLCSLMADYALISDLLKYSMGLDLLQGINTVGEARNRIYSLLQKLKASYLLLDGHSSISFYMHPIVRDVALSIASRDHHVFTLRKEVAIEWPNKHTLNCCKVIALHESSITELPDGLECPQLDFLFISCKDFVEVPTSFFKGMIKLQVLHLTRMRMLSAPSSIQLLGNLQTMCLDHCELRDIGIIGELKKLQFLSFIGSNIEQLPKEIGQLRCLKLLDLSNCEKLKVIPPNVISSLTQMEELYMGNTCIKWDDEGATTERRNASLHELEHLSCLTSLEIQIKDAKVLPKGLFSENLERYKIYIGDEWDWSQIFEGTRTLKLKVNPNIPMEDVVAMRLRGIEVLYLDEVSRANNVLYKVDKEGFLQLKYLHVQNNPYILCILDSTERVSYDAFPQLKSLSLSNLINLEKICRGQLTTKTFCKLNIVKVDFCDKLKNIFSLAVIKSLPQLQIIEVSDCKALEEIFAMGREDGFNSSEVIGKIELGQLRFLALKSLPCLTGFLSDVKIPISPKIVSKDRKVVFHDEHDTPITLFNEKVALPNLEALEVSAINCEKIWQNRLSAISFGIRNLTRLIVHRCGSLKYLFPSSIIRSFLHLQHLEICKCPGLKEIIIMEELREEERTMVFPQLNFLKMEDLENLTRFCAQCYIEFPSLKQLEIKQCPEVKAFIRVTDFTTGKEVGEMSLMETQPFFNTKVSFPKLEEMVISHLDSLKMIWQNIKFTKNNFAKLKSMEVGGCGKLLTLIPSNMVPSLSRLESLIVKDCDSMEEIFEETHSMCEIQLKLMSISNCQSLKNIFKVSIVKYCLQLEQLDIRHCGVLAEIVAKEQGEETIIDKFVFPKVTRLVLINLPKLITLYPQIHTLEWPMLKELAVIDCENAKALASRIFDFDKASDEGRLDIVAQPPFVQIEKVVFRSLEALEVSAINFEKIWQNRLPGTTAHFQNLKRLIVQGCGQFKYLFTSSMGRSFPRLQHLEIRKCPILKEIIAVEELKEEMEFPRLNFLEIEDLENLTSFCIENYVKFPSLKRLEIKRCPKFKTFVQKNLSTNFTTDTQTEKMSLMEIQPFFNDKVAFPNLEEMVISHLNNLKVVWNDKLAHHDSFSKLKLVKVEDCNELLTLFST